MWEERYLCNPCKPCNPNGMKRATMTTMTKLVGIEEQLAADGLRLAGEEAGWFVIVLNDEGRAVKVWATDAAVES